MKEAFTIANDARSGSMRHGKHRVHFGRIDLCVIIGRAMHAVGCIMRERKQRLTASFPDESVWIECDASSLEQAFVDLLVDAARYTDSGGGVTISVEQEANEAFVRIRDSGVGRGQGLQLARSVIESHGGQVTVASEGAASGSEFTVRLPAFICT